MKIVTIDSDAYKSLMRKIDRIFEYVKSQDEMRVPPQPDPASVWLDDNEAAALLEISKRTLQRLRAAGEVTYSIRGGKARCTLSEVQRLAFGHVVKSKFEQEADLMRTHQQYRERRKAVPQPCRNGKGTGKSKGNDK